MKNSGQAKIVIILLAFAVVGAWTYFIYQQKVRPAPTERSTVSNWQTFRHPLYGFSFRYPPGFTVKIVEFPAHTYPAEVVELIDIEPPYRSNGFFRVEVFGGALAYKTVPEECTEKLAEPFGRTKRLVRMCSYPQDRFLSYEDNVLYAAKNGDRNIAGVRVKVFNLVGFSEKNIPLEEIRTFLDSFEYEGG